MLFSPEIGLHILELKPVRALLHALPPEDSPEALETCIALQLQAPKMALGGVSPPI